MIRGDVLWCDCANFMAGEVSISVAVTQNESCGTAPFLCNFCSSWYCSVIAMVFWKKSDSTLFWT